MINPSYLQALFPAQNANLALSSDTMIARMIKIECAYLRAMFAHKQIDNPSLMLKQLEGFTPDYDALTKATALDGVVVPELVRQMRSHCGGGEAIHQGMTSQDVIDTAYSMGFTALNQLFEQNIKSALTQIDLMIDRFGDNRMMARTRMQAALEIKAAIRLKAWCYGLKKLESDLKSLRPMLEQISLGGAVGDGRHWGEMTVHISKTMADELGLYQQDYNWHSLRASIQDYGNFLAKVAGHNAKIGQDIVLMAQQGIDEIKLSCGGKSSAMAHKSNPILAESLISLGRYNAGQLGILAQATIHEQERSGAAWMLEWLVLPQMLSTAEASLTNLNELLGLIDQFGLNQKYSNNGEANQ